MNTCESCGHENADDVTHCEQCASPLASGSEHPFADELMTLIHRNQKIEAIKRYREETGSGLAEAKQVIEALEAGRPLPGSAELDEQDESRILSALRDGEAIEAIKFYREATGSGLKDSRIAVEMLARKHQIPMKTGCAGMLLLAATLATTVAAIVWTVPF